MDGNAIESLMTEYRRQYPPLINVVLAAVIARTARATIHDWSSRGLLNAFKTRAGRRVLLARDPFIRFVAERDLE